MGNGSLIKGAVLVMAFGSITARNSEQRRIQRQVRGIIKENHYSVKFNIYIKLQFDNQIGAFDNLQRKSKKDKEKFAVWL